MKDAPTVIFRKTFLAKLDFQKGLSGALDSALFYVNKDFAIFFLTTG